MNDDFWRETAQTLDNNEISSAHNKSVWSEQYGDVLYIWAVFALKWF